MGMEFDFASVLSTPCKGDFYTSTESCKRGVKITEIEHLYGDHKLGSNGAPVSCGNSTKLGSEKVIVSANGMKQYYNLADGGEILVKKGKSGSTFMDDYAKVLFRPQRGKDWEILAFKNRNFSFLDIDRYCSLKFPDFVDIFSENSRISKFFPFCKLRLDESFKGFGEKISGLTKLQLNQLSIKVLKMLR